MKKAIFWMLLNLITLILAMLVFLLGTHTGLIFFIKAVDILIPGHVEAQATSGSLLENLHLEKIIYRNSQAGIKFKADDLHLQWHIAQFFPLVIQVQSVNLSRVALYLPDKKIYQLAEIHLTQTRTTLNNADIGSLTATSAFGNATLSGQLDWSGNVKWNVFLNADHLNAALIDPKLKSSLTLAAHTQGQLSETQPYYFLDLRTLTGIFSGLPVTGQGTILMRQNDYEFNQLILGVGGAHLQANGVIKTAQANLQWQLQVPSLHRLLPDAEGQISSTGQVTGDIKNPHIVGNMAVNQLKWNTITLAKLNAVINAYTNLNDPSQLRITFSQLIMGLNQISVGQLDFHNEKKQNELRINLTMPNGTGSFDASGKLINTQQWQGKINQVSVKASQLGYIELKYPANLTLTRQSFNLQPFCTQGTLGNICFQQAHLNINQQKMQGAIQLSSQDLSFINLFFPQLTKIGGRLSADFRLAGTTTKPLVSGKALLENGTFDIPALGIKINNIQLNTQADSNNLHYTAKAGFGSGVLSIIGTTALTQTGFPTRAVIKGSNLLVMNTSDAVVKADPDIRIDWLNPLLSVKGTLTLPFASITPRDLTTTITLPSDVVFITPEKQTPQETLKIDSYLTLKLGDNIAFSYAGLTGKIGGSLKIEDKAGGDTTASGTLVIHEGKYKAYGQDLSIRQGKLIYTGGAINNPGLNIEASKSLQLVSTATSAKSMGSGYSTSRQIVGVRITGTLTAPSAKLFAEPPGLSQSDILSYLVLGRPASQSTQSDTPSILQALSLLNMGGGVTSQLKNQFASAFGLSQLSLDKEQEYDQQQNSVVENTSLLLGKTLSPRLLVTYSLGLIEPINTLKVAYKLRNNVSLQSEHSTEGNGVDLFYTIEKN